MYYCISSQTKWERCKNIVIHYAAFMWFIQRHSADSLYLYRLKGEDLCCSSCNIFSYCFLASSTWSKTYPAIYSRRARLSCRRSWSGLWPAWSEQSEQWWVGPDPSGRCRRCSYCPQLPRSEPNRPLYHKQVMSENHNITVYVDVVLSHYGLLADKAKPSKSNGSP